ncbi:MAG: sulfotransferase [Pirellulales bacterium]
MPLRLQFDRDTATRIADHFEHSDPKTAADMWLGLCADNPYHRPSRERFGDLLYRIEQPAYPLGTEKRSRFILRVMGNSFPTPLLTAAYFENLDLLLARRPLRDAPGLLVLGIGPGRCGSTTLAAALAALPATCSTHENPATIFWQPAVEQLQFHFARFQRLRERFAIVADCSHWWLNALDDVLAEFPEVKVLGLERDTASCSRSFAKIKGTGPGTLNHWAAPGNGIWAPSPGDPLYPTYAVPTRLLADPDAAKLALIERYVDEYNQGMREAAARHPLRMRVLRTDDLNSAETWQRISDFLGQSIARPPVAMNVGGTADSDKLELTF